MRMCHIFVCGLPRFYCIYPHYPNEQRKILHEIRKRKANWIGHILRRNCILKQVIEGKIKEEMEVTRRRGRRRKKLLDDLQDRRGYSHLKEDALDRTMWRNRFRGGFGPVVRQNTEWMNDVICSRNKQPSNTPQVSYSVFMIFMDVTKCEISLHKYKILALFRNIYLAQSNPRRRNFSLTAQWSCIPVGLYSCRPVGSTWEIHKIQLVSMAVRKNVQNLYHDVLNILLLRHYPKGECAVYQWVPYTNIFKLPRGVKYLVTHLLSLLFLAQFPSQKNRKKSTLMGSPCCVFFFHISISESFQRFL